MSKEQAAAYLDALRMIHDRLCDLQHPAANVFDAVNMAAERDVENEQLGFAAKSLERGFEQIVGAACAIGCAIEELEKEMTA